MKKLKIQIAKWLLKKSVKWSEIEPLDFYRMFSNEIYYKQINEAKEHFGKFKGINKPKWGWGSVSEDIRNIDPEAIKFIENN